MNNNSKSTNTTGRIEYIDALRGFTMILVVLNHVALFCLGIDRTIPSYHKYLQEIQMPLFFFISGFVLYKPNTCWNNKQFISFFKRKIPVLIIAPFLFLCIYLSIHHIHFKEGLFDDMKCGYWFTFVLFYFLLFYAITQYILNKLRIDGLYRDVIMMILGFTFYFVNYFHLSQEIKDLFSISCWHLYIFFVIGVLSRKHIQKLQSLLDKGLTIAAILTYVLLNIFRDNIGLESSNFLIFVTVLSGVIVVFSLFRRLQPFFTKKTITGNCMMIIGKRTLDIYLIHFFLLPVFLKDLVSDSLTSNPIPIIEMTISILIALIIIGGSLVISHILRLSPFLAHWLFGAKYPAKN